MNGHRRNRTKRRQRMGIVVAVLIAMVAIPVFSTTWLANESSPPNAETRHTVEDHPEREADAGQERDSDLFERYVLDAMSE